jgi:sporulation integral membrane protein YtvI
MITILLYGVFGIAIAFFFLKYLFVWLLPFIIAWGIATLINPLVGWLTNKLHCPAKISSAISVTITIAVVGLILYFAIGKISRELMEFVQRQNILKSGPDNMYDRLHNVLSELLQRFSFGYDSKDLATQLLDNLSDSLSGLTTKIISFVTDIAAKIPSLLLLVIVTIISSYFISSDFDRIKKFIAIQIPVKFRPWLGDMQEYLIKTVFKFVKSYLLIMSITFIELFFGFTFLRLDYALTIAALTAVVDILPVLGIGTVLIPWALISLISGNPYRAIGLVVLYALITIIRQIIEPKIIGHNVGLYPLVTLVSMYIGFKAIGVGGMFLFPFAVIFVKYIHDSGKLKLWNNLPKSGKNTK